jgi:rhodanese-related sulfurtransferase
MTAMAAAEEIQVDVAYAMWRAGDLIVDVRTSAEYVHAHIAGAINIPLDLIPVRVRELPPGQVVAVCSMGNRSRRGAEAFARAGREAFSMRGGVKAWARAGLAVVTGPDPGERDGPGGWRRLRDWLRR